MFSIKNKNTLSSHKTNCTGNLDIHIKSQKTHVSTKDLWIFHDKIHWKLNYCYT